MKPRRFSVLLFALLAASTLSLSAPKAATLEEAEAEGEVVLMEKKLIQL
jgi:hypothetical protein